MKSKISKGMPMRCQVCGLENPSEIEICSKCGTPLTNPFIQPIDKHSGTTSQTTPPVPVQESPKSRFWILLPFATALLEAAMKIIAFIGTFNAQPTPDRKNGTDIVQVGKTDTPIRQAEGVWTPDSLTEAPPRFVDDNKETLREAHQRLRASGFDPGPIDGIWGPRTKEAVRKFQKSNRLPETGELNLQTLDLLVSKGQPAETVRLRQTIQAGLEKMRNFGR